MSDGHPRTQILRLEDEIEELTEVLERCRKIILISKIAVAAGGIWLLTLSSGIIRFDPVAMIGAIAVVIGGTVVFWIECEYIEADCRRYQNCRSTQSRTDW
jgi:hypothetical protein